MSLPRNKQSCGGMSGRYHPERKKRKKRKFTASTQSFLSKWLRHIGVVSAPRRRKRQAWLLVRQKGCTARGVHQDPGLLSVCVGIDNRLEGKDAVVPRHIKMMGLRCVQAHCDLMNTPVHKWPQGQFRAIHMVLRKKPGDNK